MPSQVEIRKKALEATESLLGYPDAEVKSTAREVADYLRGLHVGVDEFLGAVTPEGYAMTRIELKLSRFIASGRLYEFKRPIRVVVVWDNSYFLAFSNAFLLHGTGDTVKEALRDYMEEWHRHYRWLLDEVERLAPPLQKELLKIQRVLLRDGDAA